MGCRRGRNVPGFVVFCCVAICAVAGAANVNGSFFFAAADTPNGEELWKTDGTAEGTILVTDILPGEGSSSPSMLTAVGDTLYFVARGVRRERELYKTDGTPGGTVLLEDIPEDSTSSGPLHLTDVQGTLFFVLDKDLWKSDGTPETTVLVKPDLRPRFLADVNGQLLCVHYGYGFAPKLWVSDGTAEGTVQIKAFHAGRNPSFPDTVATDAGVLFFGAFIEDTGQELWKTDGTAGGTVLIKDIYPGKGHASPAQFTEAGGTVYFSAHDGTYGRELWRSDGTAAGTVLVKDIAPGEDSSRPWLLTPLGGGLLFTAQDAAHGRELWKTDGTAEGSVLVKDIAPGEQPSNPVAFAEVNGVLFFLAEDGVHGRELWRSDGTSEGTMLVKDIAAGAASSNAMDLTALGDTLVFSADDGTNGRELWRSDGTPEGTILLKDIVPAEISSAPRVLGTVGGTVLFEANDGVLGKRLWASDGTPDGTVLRGELDPRAAPVFLRGDCNSDGLVDVADANWMTAIGILDGPFPQCHTACDANDDGSANIADGVYVLEYLFEDGPAPRPPFPFCGPDPTADLIDSYALLPCRSHDCGAPQPIPDPDVVVRIPDAYGGAGGRVRVPVMLDTARAVSGWSFSVCHDPSALNVVGVVLGEDAASAGMGGSPDFFSFHRYGGAWDTAVVIDVFAGYYMEPGDDYELAIAEYEVLGEPGAVTELTFCDHPGMASGATTVSYWGTRSALPVQQAGSITVSRRFTRGDANADGSMNIADAIFVLSYLFADGPAPPCLEAAETNDDNLMDLADGVYVLQHLFVSAPPPPTPFPECGVDATNGALPCRRFPPCD